MRQYQTIIDIDAFWACQDDEQLASLINCDDTALSLIWAEMACVRAAAACGDIHFRNTYTAVCVRAWEEPDGGTYRLYRVAVR